MDKPQLKQIIEAVLLASGQPLTVDKLVAVFGEDDAPEKGDVRDALKELAEDHAEKVTELKQVGSGWRIQVRGDYSDWVGKLSEEKPPRYSRALMETLALIAYRQPITRGDIEDIRGVSVSSSIMQTLLEREWVRVVGRRDVPGHPSLYGTTRQFLDYFNLKSLDELPTLGEIRDLDEIHKELELELGIPSPGEAEDAPAANVVALEPGDEIREEEESTPELAAVALLEAEPTGTAH